VVALKDSLGQLQWKTYWTCSVSQRQKQSCLNPLSLWYFWSLALIYQITEKKWCCRS